MAINPMEMMKMKQRLELFNSAHPRVAPFFQAVRGDLREGTVVELKVTTPEGEEKVTNIRLNSDDVETLGMVSQLNGKN